jgi:LysR family transcriptional regulator, nod-box dependent transcriptional activator
MPIIDALDIATYRRQHCLMDVSAALRRADLNLLLPLDALLEHRHVTRAAEALGIGQPAMSAALARLRRMFGDPLLVRNGRVHELTPLAQALVEPVHVTLTSLEQLLATEPHFDAAVDARNFSIVASDYVTLILLRPLLERLYAKAPRVVVNVVPVGAAPEIELERAQGDLVIMPREISPGMRRFPHQALFTDRYVVAVWNQNREVTGDTFDREQLERLGYVRHSPVAGGPASIDLQLAELGIEPNVALSTVSFTLMPFLLPGTPLFAFVHERLLRAPGLRRELKVLEPPVPLRPITQTMYWHPVFHNDPAHHWLREYITTLAANL